eukprot:1679623-Alexandrium_andersonii.AAC.1
MTGAPSPARCADDRRTYASVVRAKYEWTIGCSDSAFAFHAVVCVVRYIFLLVRAERRWRVESVWGWQQLLS